MLILCLTEILQLVAAQNNMELSKVVPGSDVCHSQRAATAVHSIQQHVREILSALHLSPPCGDGGLWTRVAHLNMSDPLQECPPSWRLYNANSVRACGRQVTTEITGRCYSQKYTTQLSYHRVCGQIIGYQIGSTNIFGDQQLSINEPYVDGISVTYGEPRKHIWTFAGGMSETIVAAYPKHTCPCALNGTGIEPQQPPAFVGDNYFCESANPLTTFENTGVLRYTDDPLWDGERCEGQCCTNPNSPPWFSATLPKVTSDDIEVHICANQPTSNEDAAIGLLEIYVQ